MRCLGDREIGVASDVGLWPLDVQLRGSFWASVRSRRWRPVAPRRFGSILVEWCRRGDPQSPEEGLGVGRDVEVWALTFSTSSRTAWTYQLFSFRGSWPSAATRAAASSFSSSSNSGLCPHRPVSAESAKRDQEDEKIGRVLIAIMSLPMPYIFDHQSRARDSFVSGDDVSFRREQSMRDVYFHTASIRGMFYSRSY